MNHLFSEEHSQLRLAIYHDSAVLCTTTPAGEHHKKKADVPTLPPPAFETASTQQVPLKLHLRPPPHASPSAQRTRAHFNPQHWLLCLMSLH